MDIEICQLIYNRHILAPDVWIQIKIQGRANTHSFLDFNMIVFC